MMRPILFSICACVGMNDVAATVSFLYINACVGTHDVVNIMFMVCVRKDPFCGLYSFHFVRE